MSIEEQKLEYYKIGAALFGIDVDGKAKKKKEENIFEFKDPSEYEGMTMEEREKLTEAVLNLLIKSAEED
mgnify:CR=1 FL=1